VTIEKGQVWGRPGPLPADGVVVHSDAEARRIVEGAKRAHRPIPPLGLLGGDLCRTVGGRGDEARLHSEDAMTLPVDLGSVLIDGKLHWFVAHLIVRRRWNSGRIIAVMNAQWLGHWDVAPRSHPGDGLLDSFDSNLSFNDRLKAKRRLPSGTHVPHPGIEEYRNRAMQLELDRPMPVHLDGEYVATARLLSIRVEPDALTCVV
jgi:hypothetical protein